MQMTWLNSMLKILIDRAGKYISWRFSVMRMRGGTSETKVKF